MTSVRPVVFHPDVEDDLAAIYGRYAAFDSALPPRLEARLNEQVERLELFPESGAILFDSYRRLSVLRFPYIVVYLVDDARIDVLAVVHATRDPAWIENIVTGRFAEPESG